MTIFDLKMEVKNSINFVLKLSYSASQNYNSFLNYALSFYSLKILLIGFVEVAPFANHRGRGWIIYSVESVLD